MSTRRLEMITIVPEPIKKAFRLASKPTSGEEKLWRERAARMTLDALGHTNLTVKPDRHNNAVTYARRWFKQMYVDHPDPKERDDAEATFDCAGIPFDTVRNNVLKTDAILFDLLGEDDEQT